MNILVTNPAMSKPLAFVLNPHNTIETLRMRINVETSLQRSGYALVLGARELHIDETLRSLVATNEQETLTIALVLRVKSGFIL